MVTFISVLVYQHCCEAVSWLTVIRNRFYSLDWKEVAFLTSLSDEALSRTKWSEVRRPSLLVDPSLSLSDEALSLDWVVAGTSSVCLSVGDLLGSLCRQFWRGLTLIKRWGLDVVWTTTLQMFIVYVGTVALWVNLRIDPQVNGSSDRGDFRIESRSRIDEQLLLMTFLRKMLFSS